MENKMRPKYNTNIIHIWVTWMAIFFRWEHCCCFWCLFACVCLWIVWILIPFGRWMLLLPPPPTAVVVVAAFLVRFIHWFFQFRTNTHIHSYTYIHQLIRFDCVSSILIPHTHTHTHSSTQIVCAPTKSSTVKNC